jgi:hypothetical protein
MNKQRQYFFGGGDGLGAGIFDFITQGNRSN